MHVPYHLWRLSPEESHEENSGKEQEHHQEPGPTPRDRAYLDQLISRQLKSWQLDTEVQAAIHAAERSGNRKMN